MTIALSLCESVCQKCRAQHSSNLCAAPTRTHDTHVEYLCRRTHTYNAFTRSAIIWLLTHLSWPLMNHIVFTVVLTRCHLYVYFIYRRTPYLYQMHSAFFFVSLSIRADRELIRTHTHTHSIEHSRARQIAIEQANTHAHMRCRASPLIYIKLRL